MNAISLKISSEFKNARLAGLCAKEIASELFDDETLADVELAVVELVNNCIEHAYQGKPNQPIIVHYQITEESLQIEVIDYGQLMDCNYLKNIDNEFDELDLDDFDALPEGGWGLKIVKNCMDDLQYQHIEQKNHWTLIKSRAGHSL